LKIIRYRGPGGKIGYAVEQPDGAYIGAAGDLFSGLTATGEAAKIEEILSPVAPPAIWCIGQNYRRHAAELGMPLPQFPVIFAKGVNAVQGPGGPILLPAAAKSQEVDYECELVVVIGKRCKNVRRERALDYVLGYTCGNDVSARDWQLRWGGGQWCRGKTFDTFAPLGPCLVTRESIPDPNRLAIRTLLNGELMQDSNTSDMIFDVPALVEFLSAGTTLLPGTAIFTGTPQGVGMARKPPRWLKDGDQVSVIVEGIGTLTNPVRAEAEGEENGRTGGG